MTDKVLSPARRDSLIHAALQAREQAYAPYSNFRVGAALLTTDGSIVKGSNVENASYGAAICAERIAVVKAVTDGMTSFRALAIASDLVQPISPCGICRQVLREFGALDMPIFLVPGNYPQPGSPEGPESSGVLMMTVEELLPYGFGPEHLSHKATSAVPARPG